ncbi:MAG TPA: EAL domain-containing protein [Acidimicrobiales bacterium]|nr:EAL domain-containing protein [Acidimicrobiales bacterium]
MAITRRGPGDGWADGARRRPGVLAGFALAGAVLLVVSETVLDRVLADDPSVGATVAGHGALLVATFALLLLWLRVSHGALRQRIDASQRFAAELFRSAPEPMLAVDAVSLRLLAVNDHVVATTRWGHDELLMMAVLDLVVEDERDALVDVLRSRQPEQLGTDRVWHVRSGDGGELLARIHAHRTTLRSRPVVLAVLRDVTEEEHARRTAGEAERRLARVLTSMHEVVYTLDLTADQVVFVNEVAAEVFGRPLDGLRRTIAGMFELVHPDDHELVEDGFRRVLDQGYADDVFRVVRPDGEVRWLNVQARRVDDGDRTLIDAIAVDVTDQRRLSALLVHQQSHDQLTGLPTRDTFVTELDAVLSMGSAHVSVVLFGIDRFAALNESAGLVAGDAVLAGLARRAGSHLGDDVLVARLGGDTFAALVTGHPAESLLEGLLAVAGEPFLVGEGELFVRLSIGVAEPQPGQRGADVLRDAHAALSEAKRGGGGRWRRFSADQRDRVERQVRTEAALRRALADGQFCAVYQPQTDLRTDRVLAVEALARWRDSSGKLVPAGEFIADAERTGLIAELGDQILRQAAGTAARWARRYGTRAPRMWVNLSRMELVDPDVADRVRHRLEEAGAPLASVGIEITETAFVDDDVRARRSLRALAAAGIPLSLDDFGTGWSSLQSLRSLPFSEVKIDRSFVAGITESPRDESIVRAVLGLAGAFGLVCVAEGIEDQAQLDLLVELGCRVGQGYFLGRPDVASVIEARLDAFGVRPSGGPLVIDPSATAHR